METTKQFESRKQDHVRIALRSEVQASNLNQLDQVRLVHEALPEIDFQDVNIQSQVFGLPVRAPVFVSSMTAGHVDGKKINLHLAKACSERNWLMGVGSQRRELSDPEAASEWYELRKVAPRALLFGNIGLSQLISSPIDSIKRLVDKLEAEGLFVHTNPLQECLQPEGTPQFRGGLKALENLCENIDVPVVLKEVGCGFSVKTLKSLTGVGVSAVDVSGAGGTHWGRVELERNGNPQRQKLHFGEAYSNWGIPTVQSLVDAVQLKPDFQLWASGGVRCGVDAAKLLAIGAQLVGIAQPFLHLALQEIETGREHVNPWMEKVEEELKIALFCTGCESLELFRTRGIWSWK